MEKTALNGDFFGPAFRQTETIPRRCRGSRDCGKCRPARSIGRRAERWIASHLPLPIDRLPSRAFVKKQQLLAFSELQESWHHLPAVDPRNRAQPSSPGNAIRPEFNPDHSSDNPTSSPFAIGIVYENNAKYVQCAAIRAVANCTAGTFISSGVCEILSSPWPSTPWLNSTEDLPSQPY